MSLDANKALARRYMEAWERGDQALFDEVLAPDFVDYMMGHLRTRDALIKQATDPNMVDRRNVIEDILAEDDRVAVRYTSHFARLPTRKRLTVTGCS